VGETGEKKEKKKCLSLLFEGKFSASVNLVVIGERIGTLL
jgi:hypothetical protein